MASRLGPPGFRGLGVLGSVMCHGPTSWHGRGPSTPPPMWGPRNPRMAHQRGVAFASGLNLVLTDDHHALSVRPCVTVFVDVL